VVSIHSFSRFALATSNVALGLTAANIRGILLDIEGTTTPVQFVYQTLFPYVLDRLADFMKTNGDDAKIQEIIRALKLEHEDDRRTNLSTPTWEDHPIEYVKWLMDQDRKSTALKVLQGVIWFDGYQSGKLRGVVFPDVPPALERWRRQKMDVRIFSSGSELAQRLLFGNTNEGDLTRFLNGYFDTTIGAKGETSSYVKIAQAFNLKSESILFVSDITRELDASRESGMKTLLCMRPGNHPQLTHGHTLISSFDQIT
jgi:enolase-phosphatase E1